MSCPGEQAEYFGDNYKKTEMNDVIKDTCPKCGKEVASQGIKNTFGTIFARQVRGTFCNAFYCGCGHIWGTSIDRDRIEDER